MTIATLATSPRAARAAIVPPPGDRVLEKPYQLEELTRTIRQMLELRTARAISVA